MHLKSMLILIFHYDYQCKKHLFLKKNDIFDKKKSFSAYVRSITFDGESPYLRAFTCQKMYRFETKFAHFQSKTVKKGSFLMLFRPSNRFLALNH